MARKTQVKINGTDVTAYIIPVDGWGWRHKKSRNSAMNIDQLEIHLALTVTSVLTPAINDTVEMWSGKATATEVKKFKGVTVLRTLENYGYVLTCYDMAYQLVRRTVAKYYDPATDPSAGNIQKIVKDLVGTYGGLTIDDTTATDPGITLSAGFPCKYAGVAERVQTLSAVPSYVTYYDPIADKINWRAPEYTANGNAIVIGGATANVAARDKWQEVTQNWLCNSLYLVGAYDRVFQTVSFNGDGVTTTFTLPYIPEQAWVYVGGVEKIGGKANVTTTYDYTINKEKMTVTFVSAPGAGSGNVQVKEAYNIPTLVYKSNSSSIDLYGKTEMTITLQDALGIDDAEVRASAYVDTHGWPVRMNTFTIGMQTQEANNYQLNDQVPVTDNFHTEMTGTYVIYQTVECFPDNGLQISVSDQMLRGMDMFENTQTRLKRLEEQIISGGDVLTIGPEMQHDLTLKRYSLQVDVQNLNDSFILSSNQHENSLLTRGKMLDYMDGTVTARWTGTNCTLAADGATLIGAALQTLKLTSMTSSTSLASTTSQGDLSTYTGVASGTPAKGCVGLYFNKAAGLTVSAVKLRIGSSASNYREITGVLYADDGWQTGWNYITFPLTNGSNTGTPNWTSVAYQRIEITFTGTGDVYLATETISKSNVIGWNMLGDRTTSITKMNVTY